ncbi:hypothetical protein K402DRAFT_398794 [Aulographum hederae CBS 113979]|uniref:Uncharacterized protein n=1 Tax=Aulographum hederae CBS 113979 TaxID=1176131 RepID=A0A6G1GK08_9PEZI|nr:hypothetical protein K402DRAFT_398794 [Aulographum hederae CBS 113979]
MMVLAGVYVYRQHYKNKKQKKLAESKRQTPEPTSPRSNPNIYYSEDDSLAPPPYSRALMYTHTSISDVAIHSSLHQNLISERPHTAEPEDIPAPDYYASSNSLPPLESSQTNESDATMVSPISPYSPADAAAITNGMLSPLGPSSSQSEPIQRGSLEHHGRWVWVPDGPARQESFAATIETSSSITTNPAPSALAPPLLELPSLGPAEAHPYSPEPSELVAEDEVVRAELDGMPMVAKLSGERPLTVAANAGVLENKWGHKDEYWGPDERTVGLVTCPTLEGW